MLAPNPFLVAGIYGLFFGGLIFLWCTIISRVVFRRCITRSTRDTDRAEVTVESLDDEPYDPVTGFRKPKKPAHA